MSEALPSTPLPPHWKLERQVTPAVILALMIQTGAALLWAGGAAERIAAVERRLDRQSGVNERLARLETQADANRLTLARIEAKLDREPARDSGREFGR